MFMLSASRSTGLQVEVLRLIRLTLDPVDVRHFSRRTPAIDLRYGHVEDGESKDHS